MSRVNRAQDQGIVDSARDKARAQQQAAQESREKGEILPPATAPRQVELRLGGGPPRNGTGGTAA